MFKKYQQYLEDIALLLYLESDEHIYPNFSIKYAQYLMIGPLALEKDFECFDKVIEDIKKSEKNNI